MKARKLLAIPLLAAALMAGACQAGTSNGDSGGKPSIAASDSQDINAQDRANLAQGGELRLPIDDVKAQWNGMQTDGNEATMSTLKDPLLPKYFHFDAAGTPHWDHDYLASEPTAEGNPLVVTYELNPKAVWNDGTPITYKDFVATWKACNGENKKFQCASTEGYDQIKSIEKGKDEFEVKMTYKSTYPDWTAVFTSVSRAESVKDPETFNKGWLDGPKKGWLSGPFMIQNYDKAQGNVTLVPNPKWWGEKPLLDKISWKHVSADATAAAFSNNEIDAFEVGPDPDAYVRAQKVADGEIRQAAGPDWRQLTLNTKAGLLKNKKIRQVLSMAINRKQIAASDLAGLHWPTEPLNNHVFMANQEGYEDNAKATGLTYNPEKAKQTLDEMGWKVPEGSADGIREKDGKKLTIHFSRITGVSVSENEATQLQNQLKKVGINLQIDDVTTSNWIDKLTSGDFQIMAFSWIGTPYPFPGIRQLFGTGGDSNFSQVSMPKVDKLCDQIAVEMDHDKRVQLANEADKIIWENNPTFPLYQRPDIWAAKKKLANFGAAGMADIKWVNVGYMK